MANYNQEILYNAGVLGGGANYNSLAFRIIEVSNSGNGVDAITPLNVQFAVAETGVGVDVASVLATLSTIIETGVGIDAIILIANVPVTDTGVGVDAITPLNVQFAVAETGVGVDVVVSPTIYLASAYFIVTTEGILEPLGVRVLGDSRHELIPSTRDNTEEIPGRHGEIDFGSELKARLLELHVATDDELNLTPATKASLRRTLAKYLNPVAGTKKLIFIDDETVQYEVKYAGKIDPTNYPKWFDFVIPFKMCQPLIESAAEYALTGAGIIVNLGSFETPITISIPGPATNPSISVGATVMSYTGYISAGATLAIDTAAQTAYIGSINAMAYVTGDIDYVVAAETSVSFVPSVSTASVKWRNSYI